MSEEKIDLNLINKISHDSIIKHLNQNESKKNIILSQDLIRIVDGIIKYSELKAHGVDKLYFLDNKLVKSTDDKQIEWIYIVRPEVENLRIISRHINEDIRSAKLSRFPYKILFAPRKLFICDLFFEQEGLIEYLQLEELENDLIQIDTDLLSMEYPKFFTNYFLHGDQTWLSIIAKSVINIQEWFGTIPNVHLHGSCAKSVFELMLRLNQISSENRNSYKPTHDYKIGQLILIDRSIDYVTPFCSPLTFEGLLDESFHINAGYVDLPEAEQGKKKRIKLSNEDKTFEEIRGMHISEVFNYLKKKVAEMKNMYDKKNELSSISDMKEFINNDLKEFAKNKESVVLYLLMSEIIIAKKTHIELENYLQFEHGTLTGKDFRKTYEYIEELINRNYDMYEVLRLMILLSKTNGGLSLSDFNQLIVQFLQNYGYDKFFLLEKLHKIGLFEQTEASLIGNESKSNLLKNEIGTKQIFQNLKSKFRYSTNYSAMAKKLELFPNDLDPTHLKSSSHNKYTDLSYAFNGQYRPILCQYISKILFKDSSKTNFDELAKLLPGDYLNISQASFSARIRDKNSAAEKTVLIYFLGGCTYTEIAVLKKLAQQKGYNFIFATTSFLNAHSMVNLFRD